MADLVAQDNEIILNSVRYPLVGGLKRVLTSKFADKIVTGDYSKSSMKNLDTWVINDGRGGCLIEEMEEQKHADRYFWTDANARFKGITTLGDLATSIATLPDTIEDGGFEDWSSSTALTHWLKSGTGDLARESTEKYAGSYSAKASTDAGETVVLTQTFYCPISLRGTSVTFAVRVKASAASKILAVLYDNDGNTNSSSNTGTAWEQISVARTVGSSATYLYVQIEVSASATVYIDAATLTNGATKVCLFLANYNNEIYGAFGNTLAKYDGSSAFDTVKLPLTYEITDLISSINSCLYIGQGANTQYVYMSTAEAVTTTNAGAVQHWVEWDDKLWYIAASDNQIYYAATPNSATPSWTANGTLDDIPAGNVTKLYVDVDAAGNDIIYAATKNGIFAHDTTNAKWIKANLELPEHPNAGKGTCTWGDSAYIPHGLGLTRYVADAYPAIVQEVGLDKDDGMPTEYAGEIVGTVKGYNALYCLVDASQVTGTGYSTIMAYDGKGWYCKWEDGTADQAMRCGLVSSKTAYSLWFGVGSSVYSIPLERNLLNPLRVSGKTYKTSSKFISPWFDADWQVGNKVAVKARCEVRGDVSADEDVTLYYRINHSTTTITSAWTGWTALGSAIEAAGETTIDFPNSTTPTGTTFRAIQLGMALARAAGSPTETPVVVYLALDYYKAIPKTWGWQAAIDCSKLPNYHDKSPEQLLDALVTAAETETLMTLVWNDTTKYVQVQDVAFDMLTGDKPKGTATIIMTEV